MEMTVCRLCRRERAPSSTLCKYHLAAKRGVESAYKRWNEAYGGIGWKDYLQKVCQNAETGLWAKEVAELLSREEAVE